MGQKFARYCSISYGFRDIHTFSFSTKIQDGRQKWRKLKFFPLAYDTLAPPCGSKIRWKSLYLLQFKIFTLFHFPVKSKMAAKSGENWNFSPCIGHSCTTLQVKNSLEIARSLTFFEIVTLFHFPLKFKMAAKSGENWNFSPLYRTLLYHPVGQKFVRNRSISYGFRDIHTFSFCSKIQDGRQKWRKLKFLRFTQDTLVLPCGS